MQSEFLVRAASKDAWDYVLSDTSDNILLLLDVDNDRGSEFNTVCDKCGQLQGTPYPIGYDEVDT